MAKEGLRHRGWGRGGLIHFKVEAGCSQSSQNESQMELGRLKRFSNSMSLLWGRVRWGSHPRSLCTEDLPCS